MQGIPTLSLAGNSKPPRADEKQEQSWAVFGRVPQAHGLGLRHHSEARAEGGIFRPERSGWKNLSSCIYDSRICLRCLDSAEKANEKRGFFSPA